MAKKHKCGQTEENIKTEDTFISFERQSQRLHFFLIPQLVDKHYHPESN